MKLLTVVVNPPGINAVFKNWKTVDLTEIAIAQASDRINSKFSSEIELYTIEYV